MKNLGNKIKDFFHNLHNKRIYQAFAITIAVICALMIFGFVFENFKIINGNFLSDYMATCFEAHKNKEQSWGYVFYYILLYIFIASYFIPSLIILVNKKTNDKYWCAYIIFLSIIFLVFINAYLTEMLQYDDKTCQSIYEMHLTSYISVSTIIIGIAGIKMSILLKKELKNDEANTTITDESTKNKE